MNSDDMALVREYAQSNSEQAFATLVSRHVNLVYSVALRQVRDPHLAEEITQSVFIILAGKAKSLSPKTILSGWFCRTARYVSANTLSIQRRRQFREQEAHMESILNEPEPDVWNQIAPLLDEALNYLGEKEHDAVVLRFFDGKELKQVGAAMGITEDAARMRVNRGVEKLRDFFTKKGVTLSATAITGAVAANSVQAAPAGLAAAITTAALSGTTITTTAVIAATKAIAMTTLQKTVIAAAFAVAVGTGIYEARQAANARSEMQTLQQQQATSQASIEQFQSKLTETTNRLAALADALSRAGNNDHELLALRGEVGRLRRESQELAQSKSRVASDMVPLSDKSWLDRVARLKQRLEQTPEAQIPELKLLTDDDWLNAAKGKLETDADYLSAFERLRTSAEFNFLNIADSSLRKYLKSHHDEVPTELSQLTPYFDTPQPDEILTRYHIVPSSTIPQANVLGQQSGWLITLKTPDTGAIQAIGTSGFVGGSQDMDILAPAMKAAMDAAPLINNRKSLKLEDLAPFITTPEQKAAYQKVMQRSGSDSK
jgi:RNA polymerase sigma factor (sigma-70 family)